MIDIENLVFDTVYNQLHVLFPDVNITAGYDEETAVFPVVIIRQTNSQPYRSSATDDCAENHTRVSFEIEVFSDKADTGRSECRELLDAVDGIMQGMKFRRVHLNRVLNVNRTIWRQYARYEVIVGKGITTVTENDGEQVSTTTFQMYRR